MVKLTPQQARAARRCWDHPLRFGEALGYRGDQDGRYKFGHMHDYALEFMLGGTRRSVAVPRSHAKTTEFGVILPAWRKWRLPWGRMMTSSVDKSLSAAIVGEIKEKLAGKIWLHDRDFWLADIFPELEPLGRSSSQNCEGFNVAGREGAGHEACFYATSPGSRNAGDHPTHGHLDDLTTEKNKDSFSVRQKTIAHVMQLTPVMRGGMKAPLTHAGTPWAFNDTTQWIRENPDWQQLRLSVLDNIGPDGAIIKSPITDVEDFVKLYEAGTFEGCEALCDSYLTLKELYEIAINPKHTKEFVSSQYFINAIPSNNQWFTEKTVGIADTDNMTRKAIQSNRFCNYGSILLWDPTHSIEKKTNHGDSNGIIVCRAIPAKVLGAHHKYDLEEYHNQFHFYHARQEMGGADEALAWIENRAFQECPEISQIWIEDNAAQMFLKPWLQRGGKIPDHVEIVGVKVGKSSFDYRLQGFATAIRRGFVKFAEDFPGRDTFTRQLTEYPLSDYKDLPAAAALLSTKYERIGEVPPNPDFGGYNGPLMTW